MVWPLSHFLNAQNCHFELRVTIELLEPTNLKVWQILTPQIAQFWTFEPRQFDDLVMPHFLTPKLAVSNFLLWRLYLINKEVWTKNAWLCSRSPQHVILGGRSFQCVKGLCYHFEASKVEIKGEKKMVEPGFDPMEHAPLPQIVQNTNWCSSTPPNHLNICQACVGCIKSLCWCFVGGCEFTNCLFRPRIRVFWPLNARTPRSCGWKTVLFHSISFCWTGRLMLLIGSSKSVWKHIQLLVGCEWTLRGSRLEGQLPKDLGLVQAFRSKPKSRMITAGCVSNFWSFLLTT